MQAKFPSGAEALYTHAVIAALKRCATQRHRSLKPPIRPRLVCGPEGPLFHVTAQASKGTGESPVAT